MIPHLSFVNANRTRCLKVDIERMSVQSRLTINSKGLNLGKSTYSQYINVYAVKNFSKILFHDYCYDLKMNLFKIILRA